MKNLLEKIFKNDKLFYAAPYFYLVMSIINNVSYAIQAENKSDALYAFVMNLAMFISILAITISYKKHEKNVMKGLLGGVLFIFGSRAVSNVAYYTIIDRSDIAYTICHCVWALLIIGIMISHFKLAADHRSNPNLVKNNQYLVLASLIFDALWYAFDIIVYDYTVLDAISGCLVAVTVLFVIVTVEYRVDLFKQNREQKN